MSNKNPVYRFPKGNSGRPKGTVNKFTEVKNQMLSCFDMKEFMKWKDDHYSDFVKCMCSIMPKDVAIDPESNNITIKIIAYSENGNNDPT